MTPTIAARMVTSARDGSGSDEHYSHSRVLDPIRKHFGRIVLDPWWGPGCKTDPLVGIDKQTNSLTRDWRRIVELASPTGRLGAPGHLDLYSNHPYSISPLAIAKMVHEFRRGLEGISLVRSSTSEVWYRELVWDTATAVCFMYGRLKHQAGDAPDQESDNTAMFSQSVVYHGSRLSLFEHAFGREGKVVWLK